MFLLLIIVFFFNLQSLDIHVFGDSHSSYSFCSKMAPKSENYVVNKFTIPLNFFVHYLGPKTMYRVSRDKQNFINLQKYNVKDNSVAIYCFGEIDARCHVYNQIQKSRLEDDVINILVNNYINAILEISKDYKNIFNIICCIMPPADVHDSKIPIAGTLLDRIRYTQKMNTLLMEKSKRNNFGFLNYYNAYVANDNLLNKFLSDGRTHVNVAYNFIIKAKLYDLLHKKFNLEFIKN